MSELIFAEQSEVIGLGKDKATFVEVVIGASGLIVGQVDEDSGIPITKEWTTGSDLSEPFGLILCSQSLMFDRMGGGSNATIYFGGYCHCNDSLDFESGEGVQNTGNWLIDNVCHITDTISGSGMDTSTVGAPTYHIEHYHDLPMQRVFVAPRLDLEFTHYIQGLGVGDSVTATAKFVFKRVKLTKSAYMEKLALRAYA